MRNPTLSEAFEWKQPKKKKGKGWEQELDHLVDMQLWAQAKGICDEFLGQGDYWLESHVHWSYFYNRGRMLWKDGRIPAE